VLYDDQTKKDRDMQFHRKFLMIIGTFFIITTVFGKPLSSTHYKTKVAEKVYNDLVDAVFNHMGSDIPSLEIIQKETHIARYFPRTNRIALEEKAYDICQQMGKDSLNALSFILGHELTHYLRNHPSGNFSCIHIDKNEELRSRLKHEQEADLFGLFTAYLAQYDAIKVSPKILDLLYKSYNLPEEIPNYDPLKVRQQANKSAVKEIEKLICTFETANYLTAIGDFSKATACYEAILKSYKNYEIYNNLGVLIALDAIDLSYNKNIPFAYPLELDLTSRLYKGREPYGAGFNLEREVMLEKAKGYIKEALKYDQRSASAYINLACINDLLGDFDAVEKNLIMANNANPSNAQNGHVMLVEGILAAHQGNEKLAIKKFNAVSQKYSGYNKAVAKYNIEALNSEINTSLQYIQQVSQPIDGQAFAEFSDYQLKKKLEGNYTLRYGEKNGVQYSVIDRAGYNKTFLTRTRSTRKKTADDFGVGSPEQSIREKYKDEIIKNMATSEGSFIVIPQKGLIFFIGSNKKVTEWGTFQF